MDYNQQQIQKAIVPGTGILLGRSLLGFYNMAAFFIAEPGLKVRLKQVEGGITIEEKYEKTSGETVCCSITVHAHTGNILVEAGNRPLYRPIVFGEKYTVIGNSPHTEELGWITSQDPAVAFADYVARRDSLRDHEKDSTLSAIVSSTDAAFHIRNPPGYAPRESVYPVPMENKNGQAKIISSKMYGKNIMPIDFPMEHNSVCSLAHELWELLGEHRVAVAAVRIGRNDLSHHRETCIINRE